MHIIREDTGFAKSYSPLQKLLPFSFSFGESTRRGIEVGREIRGEAGSNTLSLITMSRAVPSTYRPWYAVFFVLCFLTISFFFSSCHVTKNIPEGEYLVNKVSVEVDNKTINNSDLYDFVLQKPNDQKFRIFWYNWAGKDSSWFKRMIRKIGEAPVIYDPKSTIQSTAEIRAEMTNKGYHYNKVDVQTDTTRRKKRIRILYQVTANDPYHIRNYTIEMQEPRLDSIIETRYKRGRSNLKKGAIFDMSLLEEERTEVSSMLRNRGYYTSTKGNFHYLADTTLQNNQVDLTLVFKDTIIPQPFYIRHVTVRSGFDPLSKVGYKTVDTVNYDGITLLYDSTRLMKPKVLSENILIKPGQLYSERLSTKTYSYLMSLGSIGRVNIQYEQVDSTLLDCRIDITSSDIHDVQLGLDGTNKAGDLGIAGRIGYTHHNIFNGAEALSIKLRGAYEFVSGSTSSMLTHNFYEVGASVGLMFPNVHIPFVRDLIKRQLNVKTIYEIGFDIQERPEYTRDFFNITWKNQWENDKKNLSQTLSLIDINYVMMPRISSDFQEYLDEEVNSLTRYSYDNIFTAGLDYNITYTNTINRRFQHLYTIRFNAETSGNLLDGIFSWAGAGKSNSGQYNILGNPFAQYLKGDIGYSQTLKINPKNSFAYHLMAGVAYPYGNSTVIDSLSSSGKTSILPFEKRFYSGGPNSIRGWSTRQLGPGSYNGDVSNPSTHVGDIKLEVSIEYRYKIIKWLEFAVFADAGNIWTMFDYENQQGGVFDINRFYKEIAIGTGVGLRLDFSSLIIRLDFAKRVYDPAHEENDRWTFFTEKIKGNSGIYFAIGYPF